MIRDRLATRNERVKLVAGFLNAIGLGLIGFAVLRPITSGVNPSLLSLWWSVVGFALHALAHYVLGYIRKEATHDDI